MSVSKELLSAYIGELERSVEYVRHGGSNRRRSVMVTLPTGEALLRILKCMNGERTPQLADQ